MGHEAAAAPRLVTRFFAEIFSLHLRFFFFPWPTPAAKLPPGVPFPTWGVLAALIGFFSSWD